MKKTIFVFSIAGMLFAGYLSGVKLFSETCAFREACPIFLGYPACYFGFILYVLLVIFSGWLLFGSMQKRALAFVLGISFLGILFAGYYGLGEISGLLKNGFGAYALGLPTCMLGFVFYAAIFVLAVGSWKKMNAVPESN